MSVLFRVACAVERVVDLLPSTTVGRLVVTKGGHRSLVEVEGRHYPAPSFEYHVDYYPAGVRTYYVYLGDLEIMYEPPSVCRHPDPFLRKSAAT